MTVGERRRMGMKRLAAQRRERQTAGARLDAVIAGSLKRLGFGEHGG